MKFINKLIYGFFVVFIAVMFIVGFRESILTGTPKKAFISLFNGLPFSKFIVDALIKLFKFKQELKLKTPPSLVHEMLKLVIMSILIPLASSLATGIFLPLPAVRNQILAGGRSEWEIQEAYTNTLGYKLKKLVITLIVTVIASLVSSELLSAVRDAMNTAIGVTGTSVIGVAAIVLLTVFSAFLMHRFARIGFGTALVWRLLVTLLASTAKTIVLESVLLFIYLALINGMPGFAAGSIVAYIVLFLLLDTVMDLLRQAITL